jgi:hypothetical protein
MNANRIVVDLNKCQYARMYYRNQHGDTTNTIPEKPTVHGCLFDPDALVLGSKVSMIQFAHDHKLLDVWVPELKLQVQANHRLIYTGDKAVSIYKEWCRRIFKKKG